jgi:DNA polymerase/3'-5' exonuclease PolX
VKEKPKFAREAALEVARRICTALKPACEQLIVGGSLRRMRQAVGDVEIVYVSKRGMITPPGEIFARMVTVADVEIEKLMAGGVLARRQSRTGSEAWGAKNKLAVHTATGIPVDLFATTADCWWNYVVCRTGGAETNVAIAHAAQRRGWKWNPYGPGFSRGDDVHPVTSEREVFEFVGLPYQEPRDRA